MRFRIGVNRISATPYVGTDRCPASLHVAYCGNLGHAAAHAVVNVRTGVAHPPSIARKCPPDRGTPWTKKSPLESGRFTSILGTLRPRMRNFLCCLRLERFLSSHPPCW